MSKSKMAVSGDITVAQDGSSVKLHPYLVTLVRWCVSCVWSTATILLHRLMTTPLQPITGPKIPPKVPRAPLRRPGTEHLHPEPRVHCQLLHHPEQHALDVIFVHGLYGSLGNTWRQGDWRPKYKSEPQRVTLRNHSKDSCTCRETTQNHIYKENYDDSTNTHETHISYNKLNEKLSKKVIPEENDLITEKFYNNTLLNQTVTENTQAKFVSDIFKKQICDINCDERAIIENKNKCDKDNENKHHQENLTKTKYDFNNDNENKISNNDYNSDNDENVNDMECDNNFNELSELNECICNEKKCEVGCGCICSQCYSTCWPRDWIKVDFPGARVISINYTSDPYLWRPLWIKENKRLNLYQRAEQMTEQLLAMGVGEKPIVWVGHSKGGLYIKQIFCQAYEAYLKRNKNAVPTTRPTDLKTDNATSIEKQHYNGITADNIDTIIQHFSHNDETIQNNNAKEKTPNDKDIHIYNHKNYANDNNRQYNDTYKTDNNNYNEHKLNNNNINNDECVLNEIVEFSNVFEDFNDNDNNLESVNVINDNGKVEEGSMEERDLRNANEDNVSRNKEASIPLEYLYSNSRGFMFYSVPHRGSPLADIKTPVTARSVDLLEIAKDCPLVLELHSRWLRATQSRTDADNNVDMDTDGDGPRRVRVRSFVETCRTLMSVLWLRIVSTHSADAGVGELTGVAVDHREVCKPSSRHCLLYTELTDLIHDAINCKC